MTAVRVLLVALLVLISSEASAAPAPFPRPRRSPPTPDEVYQLLEKDLLAQGILLVEVKEDGPDAWCAVVLYNFKDRPRKHHYYVTRRSAPTRRQALDEVRHYFLHSEFRRQR